MEFLIAIFLGIVITTSGIFAYWRLKKDFEKEN